jgi:hypothetical protein
MPATSTKTAQCACRTERMLLTDPLTNENVRQRLALRPMEEQDIETLVAWGHNVELCQAAEWAENLPDDTLRQHLRG